MNSSNHKTTTRSNAAVSAAVDFSAQYDETRNVSCQTGPSSPKYLDRKQSRDHGMQLHQFNEIPYKDNCTKQEHPSQLNGELGEYPSHFNGTPFRIGELQENGTQSDGMHSTDHLHGVARNHSSQINGIPSRHYPGHYGGVPLNQPNQYGGVPYRQNPAISDGWQYNAAPYRQGESSYEGQQGPRLAWPDQNVQKPVAPFPLLRFEGRLPVNQFNTSKRAVPPFTGVYPPSNELQSEQNSNSFPLLKLPREAIPQPTKSFRLLEIPPASRDLPLLHLPTNQEKQNRPDLSKIKFAEVKTPRDPCVMLQMDNSRSKSVGPLVGAQTHDTKAPLTRNFPGSQSPMVLLHMPKEQPKPMLVPMEVLEAFERSRHEEEGGDAVEEKENVKPKKIRERKRKRQVEQKQQPRQDVRDTPSR